MVIFRLFAIQAVLLAGFFVAGPAHANDAEAEIGIGGIVLLKQSGTVEMASEELFLSEDLVRVEYRMRNTGDAAVTTTVAFPMPPQPRGFAERWYDMDNQHDFSGFGFATYVDGKPVRLNQVDRAMIGDRDVTARVQELGWPLYWPKAEAQFDALDVETRARFVTEGLLVEGKGQFQGRIVPAWDLVTYFVREQTFPPGKTVEVRHEYVPMTGGSVGGSLHRAVRESSPDITRAYRSAYCTDSQFLAGLDRRLEQDKPGHMKFYTETWLGYVLTSGALWKGPIRDFRLVVDKGSTDNLVSFCMDGVTRISATRFEVRKRDFVPRRDLQVLIAKFHEMEE